MLSYLKKFKIIFQIFKYIRHYSSNKNKINNHFEYIYTIKKPF